jgi:two-component system chemotaxis response regulator CheB
MSIGDNNFRCRVGHAWTADAVLPARDVEVEAALWMALRSLREKAEQSRKLADTVGPGGLCQRYLEAAEEAEKAVTSLGQRLSKASGTNTSDHGGF